MHLTHLACLSSSKVVPVARYWRVAVELPAHALARMGKIYGLGHSHPQLSELVAQSFYHWRSNEDPVPLSSRCFLPKIIPLLNK